MSDVSNEAQQSAHAGRRSYASRWKHKALLTGGYVNVPTLFLKHYAKLKPYSLNSAEAIFVLHLMSFKWDDAAPFPGYKTLAARMGVSVKMARRYAQDLETKKLLRRQIRKGETNQFDLTPLFDALKAVAEAEPSGRTRRKSASGTDVIQFPVTA